MVCCIQLLLDATALKGYMQLILFALAEENYVS